MVSAFRFECTVTISGGRCLIQLLSEGSLFSLSPHLTFSPCVLAIRTVTSMGFFLPGAIACLLRTSLLLAQSFGNRASELPSAGPCF
jgi:hypothetical protein